MFCCSECQKPIQKGQKIAVVGGPITNTSNNLNYNMLELVENENIIVHFDCFQKRWNQKKCAKITTENILNHQEFTKRLKLLGENVNNNSIMRFLSDYNTIDDIDQALQVWFENRSKYV